MFIGAVLWWVALATAPWAHLSPSWTGVLWVSCAILGMILCVEGRDKPPAFVDLSRVAEAGRLFRVAPNVTFVLWLIALTLMVSGWITVIILRW